MKKILKKSYFITGLVQAFRQLPMDMKRARWKLSQRSQIEAYLEKHSVRKLQVGSGKNLLPGWLNTDYRPTKPGQVYMDATQPLPLPDSSFDYIFSEHVIEHLWHKDGFHFLCECHRVLKPGGKIRLATPDLKNILSLAATEKTDLQKKYIRQASERYIPENRELRASFVINNFFWDFGHYFVYDEETLAADLAEAGFKSVRRWVPGESDDPNLTGIEWHGRVVGEDINRFETMVLQAVRL